MGGKGGSFTDDFGKGGKGKDESFKVHLSIIDETVTKEDIREAMRHFGHITDIHTPKDHQTFKRKNFAFVHFATERAFSAALNVGQVNISGCEVEIKPAAGASAASDFIAAAGKAGSGGFAGPGYGADPW